MSGTALLLFGKRTWCSNNACPDERTDRAIEACMSWIKA
jgi:hypothetical protein